MLKMVQWIWLFWMKRLECGRMSQDEYPQKCARARHKARTECPTALLFLCHLSRSLSQSPRCTLCSANHCQSSISLYLCSADSNLDSSLQLHFQIGTFIVVPFTRTILRIVPVPVILPILHPITLPIVPSFIGPVLLIVSRFRPTDRWDRGGIHCSNTLRHRGSMVRNNSLWRMWQHCTEFHRTTPLPLRALGLLVTPFPTVTTVTTALFYPPLIMMLVPPISLSFPAVALSLAFLSSFLLAFLSLAFAFSFHLSFLSALSLTVSLFVQRSMPTNCRIER